MLPRRCEYLAPLAVSDDPARRTHSLPFRSPSVHDPPATQSCWQSTPFVDIFSGSGERYDSYQCQPPSIPSPAARFCYRRGGVVSFCRPSPCTGSSLHSPGALTQFQLPLFQPGSPPSFEQHLFRQSRTSYAHSHKTVSPCAPLQLWNVVRNNELSSRRQMNGTAGLSFFYSGAAACLPSEPHTEVSVAWGEGV